MGKTPKQLVATIFEHDRFGNDRAEPSHPSAQPDRYPPAVEGQIRAARTLRHYAASVECSASIRPSFTERDFIGVA